MNAKPTTAPLRTVEDVDEELLALPAPPWHKRLAAMTAMALTVAVCLVLLSALLGDLRYFFSTSASVDLGEATSVDVARVETNRFVRVEGTPMASTALRYSRMTGEHFEVSALAGQRAMFVHRRVTADLAASPRRQFTGRIVTFRELGSRAAPVLRHLQSAGYPVSSETLVLLVDEPPSAYATSLGLALLTLLFILVNVGLLWRWFRPLRP